MTNPCSQVWALIQVVLDKNFIEKELFWETRFFNIKIRAITEKANMSFRKGVKWRKIVIASELSVVKNYDKFEIVCDLTYEF